jgi:hypothetical protein
MMASKVHAKLIKNVANTMGKIEELEKGMHLLDRMWTVIQESMYY